MSNVLYKEFKTFKKVDAIEIKRCFVAARYIQKHNLGKKRYLSELTREQFQTRLEESKKYVLGLTEQELDAIIAGDYKKRLKAYNMVDWYIGVVYTNEIGVWKSAGGLPLTWTHGSLADTGKYVIKAFESDESTEVIARAKRVIPRIRPNLDLIESDPYLYPIVLPGGTMGRGIKGRPYKDFQLMKGDIDDGCMRAITLVSSGRTKFHAYVGIAPQIATKKSV